MPPVRAQPCVGDEALLADGVHSGLLQGWGGGARGARMLPITVHPHRAPPASREVLTAL